MPEKLPPIGLAAAGLEIQNYLSSLFTQFNWMLQNCHTLPSINTTLLHALHSRFSQQTFGNFLFAFFCTIFTLFYTEQKRKRNPIDTNVFTHNTRRSDPERTTDRGSEYWDVVVAMVVMKMVAVMRYFYLLDNLLLTLSLTVHGMEMRFG